MPTKTTDSTKTPAPKKKPAAKKRSKKRSAKKKSVALADLPGLSDPRAPIDGQTFLKAAQPVLKQLDADLLQRAKTSPAVTLALKARHAQEKADERTADAYAQWLERFIAQVGAAWLLSCVFVRTLEDRGLLNQSRIAGPGAADAQRLFFQMAPSLTERDYLLTVFRELSHYPAAKGLMGERHNPVWLLAPSAEAAKALLALFRTPSADEPAFRFGQDSTRFLGDLYQDLDEGVRKRYALLQTPDFVESFILDRTLEPAIEKFGLSDTDLIDPTCGSGHFLLGAFDRLFDHRLRAEPGLTNRQAAALALDQVYGADINPYAAAIAKFRLTLSFLDKAGFDKISDAPKLPLHVAVADSLLYNPQHEQAALFEQDGADVLDWEKGAFELEDQDEAREVLERTYAAVVGNPPYITVKDKALRDRYRKLYPSASGKYALTVPFCERFFQLAKKGGRTGQITANSFMKREFGKKMIEDFLPRVNLDLIVNTSGAYIPGHGTPTVLLFGTNEPAIGTDVLSVLAKRGEPSTPSDPAKGHVWSSIVDHFAEEGFENDYVSVARINRHDLGEHPWSLAGGGASELKSLLESRSPTTLGALVEDIGFASFTGLDDAFIVPRSTAVTLGFADAMTRPMVVGESVRDWSAQPAEVAITPYHSTTHEPLPYDARAPWGRFLWRYRTVANNVSSFGGRTRQDEGQSWWSWYRWQTERYCAAFRITFAFVATHNHFVLDRGGKVFKQTAPIIKLPEDATEDDHLALLAYLNSSTACFWMKQVFFDKGGGGIGGGLASGEWEKFFEFDGTKLAKVPIPSGVLDSDVATKFARQIEQSASDAQALTEESQLTDARDCADTWTEFERHVHEQLAKRDRFLDRLIALQEELDWWVYARLEIADETLAGESTVDMAPARQTRPTYCRYAGSDTPEREIDRLFDFTGTPRPENVAQEGDPSIVARWRARAEAIEGSPHLRLLERPEYKRNLRETWRVPALAKRIGANLVAAAEGVVSGLEMPAPFALVASTATKPWTKLSGYPDALNVWLRDGMNSEAVPYLAALRFKDASIPRFDEWRSVWELQAREDAGENVGAIPVPPKYTGKDFLKPGYYKLRGKLDVPKERFISYPGCESDEDGEPIYGWAGWDHEQRAKALATLYWNRKNEEGWAKDRLTPMLAGLEELIFWLKLWHSDKSEDYAGDSPANYYEGFLNTECAAHGLTHDDLLAWRPAAKTRKTKVTNVKGSDT